MRYDIDKDGKYDPKDGDTYEDGYNTDNGMCDLNEPLITSRDWSDSVWVGRIDGDGNHLLEPMWHDEEPVYSSSYDYNGNGVYDSAVVKVAGVDPWNPSTASWEWIYTKDGVVYRRFGGYAEPFEDTIVANGIWDWAEDFTDLIANGVWDSIPEQWIKDQDGDGILDPAMPGTPEPLLEDTLAPYLASGIYYVLDDGTVVGTPWIDVNIAIDVLDRTFDVDGSIIDQGVDENTVNNQTVKLFEKHSGEEVEGSVSYDNEGGSSTFGRILFAPDGNLKPGTEYVLRLYGVIADNVGNKLKETANIEYTFTTADRSSDGSEVAEDVTPPYVESWGSNSSYEVYIVFSERIDHSTVGPATIYADVDLAYDIVDFEDGGKFKTKVILHRRDEDSFAGVTIYVTGAIKDLAGNIKGYLSTHTFSD